MCWNVWLVVHHRTKAFFTIAAENNELNIVDLFAFGDGRGRSDIATFFTDMQVSSVTARAMSVKKPNFLHRLSNVTEGS